MSKTLKKLLSLLLALSMIASCIVPGWAEDDADSAEPGREGVELEMEDMDPAKLNVPRLGVLTDEDEIEEEAEPIHDLDDIVRVSIFLSDPATLDAGYAQQGVGTNPGAVSYRESLRREQDAVTAAIERATGSDLDVVWNLTLAVNAISANVRYGDVARIGMVDGVDRVELENRYEAETGEAAQPNTANTSSGMVGATAAWAAGYTGAGSKVAIIDTGVDYQHQSFNADAFDYAIQQTGKTVTLMGSGATSGLTLNGSGRYVSTKIPFGYNYVDKTNTLTSLGHLNDTQGEHGSHVAGIAAANRFIKSGSSYVDAASSVNAVGMAPDAQILIMKVFGAAGGAYDSDYMAAIEDAITLDCDCANLSLGSGAPGWTYDNGYQDVLNKLADAGKNEGMVVSISAGNAGPLTENLKTDLYIGDVYMHTGGSPGSYTNSLCVASADNIGSTGAPLKFGDRDVYYTDTSESYPMTGIAGSYSFVYIDAPGSASDYSTVNSAASLSGKIVIVNRGDLNFSDKGNNAANYSPKAVIVANNQAGSISMDLSDMTGKFPMVSITLADAEAIKAASTQKTTGGITYYTGSVTVTDTVSSGSTGSRDAAEVSSFSSWGVPGSLIMKPEITAPGGSIYSVFGQNKTSSGTAGGTDKYELMSGTSMAAPHITGLAAVAAQYLRENPVSGRNSELASAYSTRAIIQSLLMSTATPMKPDGSYLSILQQGAGLADVNLAVSAGSVLMMNDAYLTSDTKANADGKVKVELGDDPDKTGEYTYSFTLYNLTDSAQTFTLSTDLFTQANDGEFMLPGTETLPAGGVTYAWNGESAASNDHDVNLDGVTDAADAQAILDFMTGVIDDENLNIDAGDLDGDGKPSTYDAHLLLNYQPAAPADGYVLAAGGKAQVTVTIRLTEQQKAALNEFPNGAYLMGYTYAEGKTADGASHKHSIPVLGFFGSWTEPSMFDNMSYVDTQYGADRTPYTGNSNTNYMTVTTNGTTAKFIGNPYMVEEKFPAQRLAINSNATLGTVVYSLVRSAGTTGFAVSKLDERLGDVTEVLSAGVSANEVTGLWYSQSSAAWQNTGSKVYSINKTPASYGLKEGDVFRAGFYAIPEYNAMKLGDDMTAGTAGILGASDFRTLLGKNVLGQGAFIGYDFKVDNTEPKIESATLSGSSLAVTASDNENLAYVAVLSLDGETKYAETAPGTGTYTVTLDASSAIANAGGYVAVFAADYAGNEVAKAVKVNNNAYQEKTVYVLTNTLASGNDYLIVNRNSTGSGYALGHSGTTVSTNPVTIKAGIADTNNQPYIDSSDVASTSVWTCSGAYKFQNSGYWLRRNNSSGSTLTISTTNSVNTWAWDSDNNRLTIGNYYLRYANNTFSLNSTANSVYLFQKTTIRAEVDPYSVESVSVTPTSLDLYKGNTADLVAKVLPLTAEDRTVSWSSSNTSVASVDANGHVTALAAGTANIRATANGDTTKYAECAVNVVSVNKTLNGIVWDVDGGVYFSSFNANSLPNWTKLHNDAKGMELHSAFYQDGMYAATVDTSSGTSTLYTLNTSTYALTEVGELPYFATDMAGGPTSYASRYGMFVQNYGPYLLVGDKTDPSGGYYGAGDMSSTIGENNYVVAVAARTLGTTSATYYFLDESGKIWQVPLTISQQITFDTPTLVVDTGMSAGLLYQTLYYDGTYLYWGRMGDNTAELIIINPTSKAIYHAGDFGDGVWPAVGFYVSNTLAPAEAGEETEVEDLQLTTERLPGADAIDARYIAAAQKASEPAFGGLNAVSTNRPAAAPVVSGVNVAGEPEEQDDGTVTVTISESGATNGWYFVDYDPAVLYLAGVDMIPDYAAYSIDKGDDLNTVSLAFASKDALTEADKDVALLTFKPLKCGGGEAAVTVTTIERGTNLGVNADEDLTVLLPEHAWGEWTVTTPATCTEAGEETRTCSRCGETEKRAIAAIGHDWGEPTWTWEGNDEDGYTATATFTCKNDATHTQTVNATITSKTGEDGSVTYTATVTGPDGKTYTNVKTVGAAGYHIIVKDYTKGGATVTGIEADTLYSGEVTFTVAADNACLLAVKNADGTYTVLPCTTVGEEHRFTVNVADADVTIAVVYKGDANLDGRINTKDATLVKQVYLDLAALDQDEALQTLAADVNRDGGVSTKDATVIKQAYLDLTTIAW